MYRVFVISDQPVLLKGLTHVLESQDFAVTGACSHTSEIPGEFESRPDLILLDITAGLNLDSVSEVHARIPDSPIVLWSESLPLDCVFKTLELGVRGIVRRTVTAEALAGTLTKVGEGEMQIGFGPAHKAAQIKRQVALTPRERELVGRLRNGLRNKQIAAEMNITEGTVKIYLFRLFHKLGVRTRFELARIAATEHLQFPPGDSPAAGQTGQLM
ncbi:MAG: response regulator transcription factor [Acidobacteriota bacterium]|nr:response regulator transcription factor [Acidobacteriota bacterium]